MLQFDGRWLIHKKNTSKDFDRRDNNNNNNNNDNGLLVFHKKMALICYSTSY